MVLRGSMKNILQHLKTEPFTVRCVICGVYYQYPAGVSLTKENRKRIYPQ